MEMAMCYSLHSPHKFNSAEEIDVDAYKRLGFTTAQLYHPLVVVKPLPYDSSMR